MEILLFIIDIIQVYKLNLEIYDNDPAIYALFEKRNKYKETEFIIDCQNIDNYQEIKIFNYLEQFTSLKKINSIIINIIIQFIYQNKHLVKIYLILLVDQNFIINWNH